MSITLDFPARAVALKPFPSLFAGRTVGGTKIIRQRLSAVLCRLIGSLGEAIVGGRRRKRHDVAGRRDAEHRHVI